jgi:hypothetical protein
MKSMSNKGISTLPQKSQQGIFKGDPNKMVGPIIVYSKAILFN